MQHHTRRLALFFIASMLTGVAVLVACDTDNATTPLPGGGSSSSSSSGKPPANGDDDDTTGDDDDSTVVDGGSKADCGTAPRLRTTSAGFYCGFFKDGGADSGGTRNCSNTETCCNPGKDGADQPLSFCAEGTKNNNAQAKCKSLAPGYGTTWVETGSTTWECASTTNCGGTKKCCAHSFAGADAGNDLNYGKSTGTGSPPAACGALTLFKIGGTKCAATCAAEGELELCSSTDSTCSDGKTCTPASATGFRDLGFCK